MDVTRDARAVAESGARPRRTWAAPLLTRHASLTALTLQYPPGMVVDPRTGELLDPNNPDDRVRIADIPGSTGFFP
jgi:D-alanyl-D-alanine carboxypeptidase